MMGASVLLHDLLVGPKKCFGPRAPSVDAELCGDLARALATQAQGWAGADSWRGLGGFDHGGGFWLRPEDGDILGFERSAVCAGWLRPENDHDARRDPVSCRFPRAVWPGDSPRPLPRGALLARLAARAGFAGCALRHPRSGQWRTVYPGANTGDLAVGTRAFAPVIRLLQSQGLPSGRVLLLGADRAAIAWRSPGKVTGYVQVRPEELPATLALVDDLLLFTAHAEAAA